MKIQAGRKTLFNWQSLPRPGEKAYRLGKFPELLQIALDALGQYIGIQIGPQGLAPSFASVFLRLV